MKNITNFISSVPLFSGLPGEQLSKFAAISVPQDVQAGEIIFSEGEDGIGFYVVMSGKIKIFKMSLEGKEKILHIFGPPEPFGEVPVFTGDRFPANAQALSKARLLFFPRTQFVKLIAENPALSLNMLAVLSMRLRQFAVQIENLALKEVPARLASHLIYLAEEQGGGDIVHLAISKGQLASLLGTIPETLSRILNRMSQQQLIKVNGRRIQLLDDDGLVDLSENGKLAIS
ncbi:MAG: Crp/Fnr family transcriptional regulator [Deltaproteobacteria bacterium]|nr:Crp/Fnr family transcriptional regulator [Deltaproteobacteria bacterium]